MLLILLATFEFYFFKCNNSYENYILCKIIYVESNILLLEPIVCINKYETFHIYTDN